VPAVLSDLPYDASWYIERIRKELARNGMSESEIEQCLDRVFTFG
jgi:hypothetical protein